MPDANAGNQSSVRQWDFADVDASSDPQSFMRYLSQGDVSGSVETRLRLSFAFLDVREGQSVLDVGCGLGDDVRALASLVGKAGRAVGLDNSERILDVARSRSEQVEHPGEFCHGDMHALPFDDATFHSCRAERVLLHSANPEQAVRETVRVLRPGGRIVVCEPDLDTLIFHASRQTTVRTLTQWHSDRVRQGIIGRDLPELFRRAGLADVVIVPTVTLTTDLSEYPRTLAWQAAQAGVIARDEASAVIAEWDERAKAGVYLEYGLFFTVAGRKPH